MGQGWNYGKRMSDLPALRRRDQDGSRRRMSGMPQGRQRVHRGKGRDQFRLPDVNIWGAAGTKGMETAHSSGYSTG